MTLPGAPTILLVEDNRDDVELTQIALADTGRDVRLDVVRDGVEAIRYLRECPLPSLVLLDLNLPRIGGHEVLAFIRNTPCLSALPVVALTTSSEPADLRAARALNVNHYLQKPVEFSEFAAAMRVLVEEWLAPR